MNAGHTEKATAVRHVEAIELRPLPERRERSVLRDLVLTGTLMADYLERLADGAELSTDTARRLAAIWEQRLGELRDAAQDVIR